MPIIYDHEPDRRQLIKTSEREAIDLQTGERYKLERVDDQSSMGLGVVLGLVLTLLAMSLFNFPSVPSQQPPYTSPSQYQLEGTTRP